MIHLHNHPMSLRDNGSSLKDFVKEADRLGFSALAITDHGQMVGHQDFRMACKDAGIKPIFGCEFYVQNSDGAITHLVVLAKNPTGYNAISKVCTESAYNIKSDKPVVTLESLQRWFGFGKPGHGNVIGLSACMQGPLCRDILFNYYIDQETEKIKRKRDKELSPSDKVYLSALKAVEEAEALYAEAKESEQKNTEIAKTPWKKVYNAAVKTGVGLEEATALKEAVEEAISKKESLKARTKELSTKLKAEKEVLAPLARSVERYEREQAKITEREKEKLSPAEAKAKADETLYYYLRLFGRSNFFAEVQYHGIEAEKYAMPILVELARRHSIGLVATNDVHYARPEDAERRQYNHSQYQNYSYIELRPEDKELYMKDQGEMEAWLELILSKDAVDEAISNTYRIADQCNVDFEISTHYPVFPCKTGARVRLRQLIQKGKAKVQPWTDEYQRRLQYELTVIEGMGFSDYLCIVEDFLNYARLVGKIDLESPEFLEDPFNLPKLKKLAEGQVGEGCGPGRGSAAGSLVCYLVGITNIDPIENGLLFERFLNPERVSMPDIDSDIPPKVRPWVIAYMKHLYGEKAVAQIMTISYFSAKSAIQAAARVMGKREKDEKKYLGLSLEMSKSIEDPNMSLEELKDSLIDPEKPDSEEIFRIAKALEGLPSGYGTHAAGIVVSDNSDISDYAPLINVSGAIDTQFDLNWVEPMGLLKLDLLGLRNIGIITECEKAVLKEYGVRLSMDKFPKVPEVFSEIFSKGLTDGVFQFESEGMKQLLRSFGPESISDLTLLNAIFRPGPLQYIDDVTAVKKGLKTPEYIIPEMAEILSETYGKPIYQEQIMAIFNRFAGFSLGESDIIRRLMSKKKVEAFSSYRDKFIDGLVSAGAGKADAEGFWDELLNFSQYAFNKSHARAYAEVAYATAYLKWKYPSEYACGLLNYTAKDKMSKMIFDAKNQGVEISCPDINYSDSDFFTTGGKVWFGLRPIPQVAASASDILQERMKNGKFSSFKEFLLRCEPKKNVAENLIKAGAFDEMGKRASLLAALPDLLDYLKKIKEKEKLISELDDEAKISRALATKKKWQAMFDEYEYSSITANKAEELLAEKELLGAYISDHPMAGVYSKVPLAKVEIGRRTYVTAIAENVEVVVTKTSGKEMLTLKISDTTGIFDAVMFPGDFEKLALKVEEGKIYSFNGVLKADSEGEEVKFFVKGISNHRSYVEPLVIHAPSEESFFRTQKDLQPFTDSESGKPLDVHLAKKNSEGKKVIRVEGLYSPDVVKRVKDPDFKWK